MSRSKIGDYVIVARKAKNSDDWFLGAITDEEGRAFTVPLTFLTPGRKYVAEIYADAPGANWATNPLPVAISKRNVDSRTRLDLILAPGGGQAIRITAAR
jgi:alpha-glucosidase